MGFIKALLRGMTTMVGYAISTAIIAGLIIAIMVVALVYGGILK